jgi:hypothetical protein
MAQCIRVELLLTTRVSTKYVAGAVKVCPVNEVHTEWNLMRCYLLSRRHASFSSDARGRRGSQIESAPKALDTVCQLPGDRPRSLTVSRLERTKIIPAFLALTGDEGNTAGAGGDEGSCGRRSIGARRNRSVGSGVSCSRGWSERLVGLYVTFGG